MDATDSGSAGLLYLQVAERLAGAIRSGSLDSGERMPSVRELARQHGVSLTTVTQAYRWLEDQRLVEARPRSGYFVAARVRRLPEPEVSQPPADSRAVDISSLVEQVMTLANDRSVISFGAACPSEGLFNLERVRRAFNRAALRQRATLCRYPFGTGQEELRRAVARRALGLGCELDPAEVVITGSCLEAITLCLRCVTRPGDVVALESPTHFGFLEILESLHLRALEIPTHPRHGISLDALQLALDTQPVRAVLLVPTLSNPLGACMPLSERRRLAQMLAERRVPLVEDVLYNDLAEQDDRRRAVKSFDASGNVMICGSFSKTLAPGLRLGWVDAGRWGTALRRMKSSTSGSQTAVVESALAELLAQPGLESSFRQLRATIAARVDDARGLIAQSFPKGTRVTDPAGGYILWVELPQAVDSIALFHACVDEGICIAPGTMFSTSERFRHCIRLGVGGHWDEARRSALQRVGRIAAAMADAGYKPGQALGVAASMPASSSTRSTVSSTSSSIVVGR
ncbi:PLP-dependent aminotransferase family protein [Caldimonas sp. KR1-144]|uniref:aminotransferase-like domain-containing protein n=1 Tax=Caldimonas sp. KR1-144 TaxID=3400911 RepID=UPI003C0D831E